LLNVRRPGSRIKASSRQAEVPAEHQTVLLENQRLCNETFSRRVLLTFAAVGSRFEECDFRDLDVEDASFGAGTEPSVYVECVFDGSRLRAPSLGMARFERCSFRDVELTEWISLRSSYVDCVFSGQLRLGIFSARPLPDSVPENEIRGNDFTQLEMDDVAFRGGVDLGAQRMPDSKEYEIVKNARDTLAGAKDRVQELIPAEDRDYALGVLSDLLQDVEDGQEELFLIRRDWTVDDVQTKLFEALLQASASRGR
jgi:uncharacterized protein YjbI with pentapeptide repeats